MPKFHLSTAVPIYVAADEYFISKVILNYIYLPILQKSCKIGNYFHKIFCQFKNKL